MEEIHIPVSVKTIESEAFDGSNNIKRVYYDGSQNQWNQIEIGSSNDGFLKGTIYYGNEEDCTTTGWKSINGVWYYFDASGSMHPEDYPWSSYRTILRMTDDRITQPEKTLAFFKQSIFYYREFVEDATHKYKINENMIQKEIGEDEAWLPW